MELGEKIRTVRKHHKLSLKELSEKTGISISFLSDIENSRSNPSLENLKLISKVLTTPISYFVEDTDSNIFSESINDSEFIPVIELLQDFSNWNVDDKKELVYYLKAKKIIRDNK